MKSFFLVLLAVCGAALATSSFAGSYLFGPTDANFKLKGKLNIVAKGDGGKGTCSVVWTGKTRPTGASAEVTDAVFRGHKPVCQINSTLLRIDFAPAGFEYVKSHQIGWTLDGPKKGSCDGMLEASVDPNGLWTFNSVLGACTITGALQSYPAVTVVTR